MHLRFGVSSAVVDAFLSKTNIDFPAHDTKKERLLLVNQIVDASASIRGLFRDRQPTSHRHSYEQNYLCRVTHYEAPVNGTNGKELL